MRKFDIFLRVLIVDSPSGGVQDLRQGLKGGGLVRNRSLQRGRLARQSPSSPASPQTLPPLKPCLPPNPAFVSERTTVSLTHRLTFLWCSTLLIVAFSESAMSGESTDTPRPSFAVWETGAPSADPIAPSELSLKDGWTRLSRGKTPAAFNGDLVMSNGRLAAVIRKHGAGVELYSLGLGEPVFRERLLLMTESGETAQRIDDAKLIKQTRSSASIEIFCRTATGRRASATFRIKRGDVFVQAEPGDGAARLRVETSSRFVVLPDFFANDIVIDAQEIPVDSAQLPSENFVLQMSGDGDAIALTVFENRDQEIRITLTGTGDARSVTGSEIEFGNGHKIWTAILENRGIWHTLEVQPEQAKDIISLQWKMPFVAQWRVDFTRPDGLTDGWDMLLPEEGGDGYVKPSWISSGGQLDAPSITSTGNLVVDTAVRHGPLSNRLGSDRKKWIPLINSFLYPAWSDREGNGFVQPMKVGDYKHQGPVLIYPLNRLDETPISDFTVVDVMRNTLGVGPCKHILDVEGQNNQQVGRGTCDVRSMLFKTYGRGMQQARREDILIWLEDSLTFVTHIRDRVDMYAKFGRDLRLYLAEQKLAHPELTKFLSEVESLSRQIDQKIEFHSIRMTQKQPVLQAIEKKLASSNEKITTRELANHLREGFVETLIDYDGKDWRKKMEAEYTDPMFKIGCEQDILVGACRGVVKMIRQKAGIETAIDPRVAQVATEIRSRCHNILRGAAAYEAAGQ